MINPARKLHWYQRHMPEELNAAKAIFLREVGDAIHMCYCVLGADIFQLRHYYKEPSTPAQQPHDVFSDNTWADDILGLNFADDCVQSQGLEAEVEAYLLDSQTGTSSLVYWQVRVISFVLVQYCH